MHVLPKDQQEWKKTVDIPYTTWCPKDKWSMTMMLMIVVVAVMMMMTMMCMYMNLGEGVFPLLVKFKLPVTLELNNLTQSLILKTLTSKLCFESFKFHIEVLRNVSYMYM